MKYSIISTTFLSIGRVTASGVSSFTGSQRNDWPDAVGCFFYKGIAEEWSFLKPKPVAHRRNDRKEALLENVQSFVGGLVPVIGFAVVEIVEIGILPVI